MVQCDLGVRSVDALGVGWVSNTHGDALRRKRDRKPESLWRVTPVPEPNAHQVHEFTQSGIRFLTPASNFDAQASNFT